jgi:hypothetical protein
VQALDRAGSTGAPANISTAPINAPWSCVEERKPRIDAPGCQLLRIPGIPAMHDTPAVILL